MDTAPMDPRKACRAVSDKVEPPRGAYKRSSKDCLPVAIPGYTIEANAAALLVSEEDFDCAIAHTITSSRVLTAWVAFQMAHIDVEDSRTMSKWRVIDDIIASRFQLWDAQYRSSSELYLSPVELARMKVSELNALAVFVLCRRIQDNTRSTNELGGSLTYHTYYRTFMSRVYLAAHLLTFLRYYIRPLSTFSRYRPDDVLRVPRWLEIQGACVRVACQKLTEVWDPRTILNNGKQNQALQDTSTRRTSWDALQHKHNVCFSDQDKAQGDSKTILFFIDREDLFEMDTSAIPRALYHGLSLSDTLLGCLGWPKSSCLDSIALHPEGNLASGDSVQSLAALWNAIDSQDTPVFRVQISGISASAALNCPSGQPSPPQRHSNHSILALEALVNELPDNDAQIARPLFELIQKGHSRSREHAMDLEAMFAPVKQRNAEEWEQTNQTKKIFDEVARDKSQVLKLEDLVGHLNEPYAEDARAILHVVRRNLKGGRGFAGELSRLFQPVKQRNAEAWKRASRMKKIFDKFEQASQPSGAIPTQSLRSEVSGEVARAAKRKRVE